MNIADSLQDELNTFYARFEADNTTHTESAAAAAAEEVNPLSLSFVDVTRSFKLVNIRKAVGPNGIPGRVLRACTFQLAGVFTDIFNLSLSLSVVPTSFKKSTIVPIPKKNKITCLNDWRPVALTPIFSKCFEKLVREHICSVLPASLDPLQFAYRSNRSTDDAIAFTLHTALSHLENKNTYARMLFVDYSSAGCNPVIHHQLLGLVDVEWEVVLLTPFCQGTHLLSVGRLIVVSDQAYHRCVICKFDDDIRVCVWLYSHSDFLTGRSQVVRMGQQHLIFSDPQHWCSSGLRPQPTPVLPVHTWLYNHTQTLTSSSNLQMTQRW